LVTGALILYDYHRDADGLAIQIEVILRNHDKTTGNRGTLRDIERTSGLLEGWDKYLFFGSGFRENCFNWFSEQC
jgi:hypothetical protein